MKEEPKPISPPARGGARGGGSGAQPIHPTQPPLEKGRSLMFAFGTIAVIAVAFLFLYNRPCSNFNQATLTTPIQQISLALADTQEKQSRGLGGCRYVPNNSGMYFPFNPPQSETFWMKDMVIPIDIIWIKNGVVLGIEKNVPNEPLGTPDSMLKQYPSPGDIDAVLEVGTGKAREYGIGEGTQVILTK